MARRKVVPGIRRKPAKKRKTTTRRRRRVSGIGSLDVSGIAMTVLGLGAGAIIARELNTVAVKEFPTISPTIMGLVQIAAGVAVPYFIKSKLGQDVGNGMIAFGVQVEAVNLGLISGVGMPNKTVSYRIHGVPQQRVIGNPYGQQRVVSGITNGNRLSVPSPASNSKNTF
jgi:hypothetical protein